MRIGVICEGSNDFVVLQELAQKIAERSDVRIAVFDAIQPQIDATSQISGGGWGRVKGWCVQNSGGGLRKYLDQPLFATSAQYDLLLIHIDGDVSDILEEPPFQGYRTADSDILTTVTIVKSTIKNVWLNIAPDIDNKVVVAVPVLHTDAWIAASHNEADCETSPTKDRVQQRVLPLYSGRKRDKYRDAAQKCAMDLEKLLVDCISFRAFYVELSKSLAL